MLIGCGPGLQTWTAETGPAGSAELLPELPAGRPDEGVVELTESLEGEPDSLPPGWTWESGPSGIILPLAPPPDPNEPKTAIVRFLDHATDQINNRPIIPGTVAEIAYPLAMELYRWRPCGLAEHQWPSKIEFCSREDLMRYEDLMRAIEQNEKDTAADELSQTIAAERYEQRVTAREEQQRKDPNYKPREEILLPDVPKLIVRFNRGGCVGGCSYDPEDIYPIEKVLVHRYLLETNPIVELATPDELRRDRTLRDQLSEIRKRWDNNRVPKSEQLVKVRFVRRYKHPNKEDVYRPGDTSLVSAETALEYARWRDPIWEVALQTGIAETGPTSQEAPPRRCSGSAERFAMGEAQTAVKAAFLRHHRFHLNIGDGELNLTPIGNNLFALQASPEGKKVDKRTTSDFFKEYFGGHRQYVAACKRGDEELLLRVMRKLIGEDSQ